MTPMTEQEWLASDDLPRMLEFLSRRRKSRMVTERKLTLFACACCRRIWPFIPTESCRKAVEVGERYVDGLATEQDRYTAWSSAVEEGIRLDDPYQMESIEWGYVPGGKAVLATLGVVGTGDVSAGGVASAAVGELALDASGRGELESEETYRRRIEVNEQKVQATLLRHIIGNPFRRYVTPDYWPSTVVQLADSLYNGEDCCFALHDALLEAGHTDLADHFGQEKCHPKGCWVVDMILGKK